MFRLALSEFMVNLLNNQQYNNTKLEIILDVGIENDRFKIANAR